MATNDVDWIIPAPVQNASEGLCTAPTQGQSVETAPAAATDVHSVQEHRRTPLLIELPDDNNDGIVRVRVKRDGHRTSISLDVMFYEAGSLLCGGSKAFEGWLQEQVTSLDMGWANKAVVAHVGDQIRPNAGFSRLIQRRILQMVIEKASLR